MGSGRKPKPTYLKLVTGNPGRRPLSEREPKVRRALPQAPDHLSSVARAEWKRVVREAGLANMLSVLDRAGLAAYCEAWARWVACERALQKMAETDPVTHGLLIKTPNGAQRNPLLIAANTTMKLMLTAASEFGFTPASRSRVAANDAPDEDSPYF